MLEEGYNYVNKEATHWFLKYQRNGRLFLNTIFFIHLSWCHNEISMSAKFTPPIDLLYYLMMSGQLTFTFLFSFTSNLSTVIEAFQLLHNVNQLGHIYCRITLLNGNPNFGQYDSQSCLFLAVSNLFQRIVDTDQFDSIEILLLLECLPC